MTERRIIHLVDDEESIRRSAGFMLRTSGFAVETYESGDAFLKVAKDADKDVVEAAAREAVPSWLEGGEVVKTIVVPGKLVNFIVK